MFESIRAIWRPGMFQGFRRRHDYFEGWYFKHVDRTESHALAVIPGLSLTRDASSSHAFIQVLNGRTRESRYFRFDRQAFVPSRDGFSFSIGENRFSDSGISLKIEQNGVALRGDVRYAPLVAWPIGLFSPGYMGPYAFVPWMECYHGVLGFDHALEGRLAFDGSEVDFSGGRGYVEKDWGSSFPRAWIWMQTNHFGQENVSLSLSVARVPWLGNFFTGFGIGLWCRGTLHRFASYTGAHLRLPSIGDREITVEVEDRRHCMLVTGRRAEGGIIVAPELGAMKNRIAETLTAQVHVELRSKPSGALVFEGTGRNGGLECVGEMNELRAGLA